MKIAIISDVHGNLEALKSTIKDIEKRNVDRIICLGDIIAKGVHSKECIALIKEKCDVILQGNCDEYFSKAHENISDMPEQWKIEKQDKNINIEIENYTFEIKEGKYRDMTRINENFKRLGIDVYKI